MHGRGGGVRAEPDETGADAAADGEPAQGVLRGLIDEAVTEHVTLQILPKSAGASPALTGAFSVLTLPEPIPDFGYAESPGGALYIEDRELVRTLLVRWGILTERALSPAESVDMITEAAKGYQ